MHLTVRPLHSKTNKTINTLIDDVQSWSNENEHKYTTKKH